MATYPTKLCLLLTNIETLATLIGNSSQTCREHYLQWIDFYEAAFGLRMKQITADEIRRVLAVSSEDLKAMLLLIVNTTIDTKQISKLRLTDINENWLRIENGIGRECPLWPETIAAYNNWLTVRPTPTKSVRHLAFIETDTGGGWRKHSRRCQLNERLRDRFRDANLSPPRTIIRDLQAVLPVVAGHRGCDPIAVSAIVNGTPYQNIALKQVTDAVREWLWLAAPQAS